MYSMRLLIVAALGGLLASVIASPIEDAYAFIGKDARARLDHIQGAASSHVRKTAKLSKGCSLKKARKRQEWGAMSKNARKDYSQAVQCLLDSPSRLTQYGWATQSRYDDFVAVHINMTRTIHGTANFLGWHRYYLHAYETALRDECNFNGAHPYWDWFSYNDRLLKSPLFDGSDSSMGGDGEYLAHSNVKAGPQYIDIGTGNGGGCIKKGPFKGSKVNLGPILTPYPEFPAVKDITVPNTHCIHRDLNQYAAMNYLRPKDFFNLTIGQMSHNIKDFQSELQGSLYPGHMGLHTAGHFVLAGDGGDLFASPNDPVFFLHHAMLDRTWWLWQVLHPAEAATIHGTITMNNNPPSRNATVEDDLDMKGLMESLTFKQIFDTLGGDPLCYIYE